MKRYLGLFKQAWTEFGEDKAQRLGASLAYYTVFSIAPLLLIAVSIAGLVFGAEAAQGAIQQQLTGVLGESTAKSINEMVLMAAKPRSGKLAMTVGIITLLFGAAGVFGQLQAALDTIWNVEKPKKAGFMGMIRDRFLSMTMVMGVGFLLLVSLVIDTAISAMGKFLGARLPGGEALLHAGQLIFSFVLVTAVFALMFRYLPHLRVEWRDVWIGSVFTSLLFVLGKFALGLYIGKAAVGSTYGAAGSLVVILIWVYWSAQILFFGAEMTQVYARSHGSMAGKRVDKGQEEPKPKPVFVPVAAKASGGKGKLAIGGAVGLVLGTLVGGITAVIIAVKSVKKVLTLPFR